jgi:hypothetical protein
LASAAALSAAGCSGYGVDLGRVGADLDRADLTTTTESAVELPDGTRAGFRRTVRGRARGLSAEAKAAPKVIAPDDPPTD